jgi:hypothetical protein
VEYGKLVEAARAQIEQNYRRPLAARAVRSGRSRRIMTLRGRWLGAALLLAPVPALAASFTAEEAGKHVGETATVCGTVASAHFSARARSQPTLLDLDKPYPDPIFTLVIFGRDRAKFGTPEQTLLHQHVCASGPITLYRGRPEMILENPAQLQR